MPSCLGGFRTLLLLFTLGCSVAVGLNNYAEFQVDGDIASIPNSPPNDGPDYNFVAASASGITDEKPANPWGATSTPYPIDENLGSPIASGCQVNGNPNRSRKSRARRDIPMCRSNFLLPSTPKKVTVPTGQQPNIESGDKKSPIPEPSSDPELQMPVLIDPQTEEDCITPSFTYKLCSTEANAVKVTYASIFWRLPTCHPPACDSEKLEILWCCTAITPSTNVMPIGVLPTYGFMGVMCIKASQQLKIIQGGNNL